MNTNVKFDCSARLTALDEQLSFVSKQFERSFPSLYQFLGECHSLVLEIGADGERIESLNKAISNAPQISERELKLAKSVAAKVSLYVFRKSAGDLINRSTRSNYKRAIEKAVQKRLSKDEFVTKLGNGGLVSFLNMDKVEKISADTSASLFRSELLTKTVESVPSMGLIENRNPSDTFAVVVYRVDAGKLVPCYASDDKRAVDGLIQKLIPIENERLMEEAERVAEEAKQKFLRKKKAA